jgi:hypothetical protein
VHALPHGGGGIKWNDVNLRVGLSGASTLTRWQGAEKAFCAWTPMGVPEHMSLCIKPYPAGHSWGAATDHTRRPREATLGGHSTVGLGLIDWDSGHGKKGWWVYTRGRAFELLPSEQVLFRRLISGHRKRRQQPGQQERHSLLLVERTAGE